MKRFLLPILITFILSSAFKADQQAECTPYYLTDEGKTVELINYDKKGKVSGKSINTVKSIDNTSSGFKVTILASQFDKKDKEITSGEYTAECADGKLKLDMSNIIDMSKIQEFEGMDIKVESELIEYPSNPTVGQELEGGKITLSASNMGMKLFSQTVIIDKRKVAAIEKKECPAGTFDCVKITYETRMQIMGKAFVYENTDWLAKGVGIVRAETYRKDKLEGYTELNKID